MATSFIAPPGSAAQVQALIVSSYSGANVQYQAPDADLKNPVLTTASGDKLTDSKAIALYLAKAGSNAAFAPANEVHTHQ